MKISTSEPREVEVWTFLVDENPTRNGAAFQSSLPLPLVCRSPKKNFTLHCTIKFEVTVCHVIIYATYAPRRAMDGHGRGTNVEFTDSILKSASSRPCGTIDGLC